MRKRPTLANLVPSKSAGFVPLTAALAAMSPYWLIEPGYADAAWRHLGEIDFRAHAEEYSALQASFYDDDDDADGDCAYDLDENGIATIRMTGVMMKRPSSWGRSCSTVVTRNAVRKAAADDRVKAIALVVDSPGGNIEGTADLAQDVYNVRGVKPIGAYIEDCGCSAAYWVASQADFLYCSQVAMVGSIGTKTYLVDSSEAGKKLGYRIIPVGSAPLKTTGTPGAPISAEQVDDVQRIVGEINAQFLGGIARGRSMDAKAVAGVSDARVHIGPNAVALKLADKVATIDQFYARLGDPSAGDDAVSDESQESDDDDIDGPDDDQTTGNQPVQPAAQISGNKEKMPMLTRASFAAALSKAGLATLAGYVLGAADDSEDAIAARLAAKAKEDATIQTPEVPQAPAVVQAPQATAPNVSAAGRNAAERDILTICQAHGIENSGKLGEIIQMAKIGEQFAAEVREDAKAEAVRAYGAVLGQQLHAQCDALPISALVPMRDAWRAEADKRFGIGAKHGEAPTRASAPAKIAVSAEAGADAAATKWEQLTDAQRTQAKAMGINTPELREAFAAEILGTKEGE